MAPFVLRGSDAGAAAPAEMTASGAIVGGLQHVPYADRREPELGEVAVGPFAGDGIDRADGLSDVREEAPRDRGHPVDAVGRVLDGSQVRMGRRLVLIVDAGVPRVTCSDHGLASDGVDLVDVDVHVDELRLGRDSVELGDVVRVSCLVGGARTCPPPPLWPLTFVMEEYRDAV